MRRIVVLAFVVVLLSPVAAANAWTNTCQPSDINYNLCTVDDERLSQIDSDLQWTVYALGMLAGIAVTLYGLHALRRAAFGKTVSNESASVY